MNWDEKPEPYKWGILDELKFGLLALILVGGCAGVIMLFLLHILKVVGEL